METWDAIRSRRNVREYTDQPIEPEQLDLILEAGRLAPSGRNVQPWDFVVVTERTELQDLAKVWPGAGHVASSAATIALILPISHDEGPAMGARYDLGQATMLMLLAATDQGIASAHTGVGDQDLARQLLGLPEDRYCAYLVALGHPAGRPLVPLKKLDRRPFDEVVHRSRW